MDIAGVADVMVSPNTKHLKIGKLPKSTLLQNLPSSFEDRPLSSKPKRATVEQSSKPHTHVDVSHKHLFILYLLNGKSFKVYDTINRCFYTRHKFPQEG